MNGPASTTIELRRLSGSPDEARLVQRIYDGAPTYAQTTTGAPSRPGAALETFGMLPDGCAAEAKHMYLVYDDDAPVGFTDVIRGFPDPTRAYIGLFILIESQHRRGTGTLAFRKLETLIGAWPGISRIRLSVVEENTPALGFWEAMGFVRTGERTPYESGPISSHHVFFEKALHPLE